MMQMHTHIGGDAVSFDFLPLLVLVLLCCFAAVVPCDFCSAVSKPLKFPVWYQFCRAADAATPPPLLWVSFFSP